MINLLFGETKAQINNGVITADQPSFAKTLYQAASMETQSGADPDRDYALAEKLAARLNGKIVDFSGLENGNAGEVN